MKLTTKGRYAVTAMLDLALRHGRGPISLADIALRQGISLSYLEQLFSRLRRNDLVASVRGPGGGYVLARDPEHIDIASVIEAVDERIEALGSGQSSGRDDDSRYLTHDLWCDLSDQIHEYLSGISLDDLQRRRVVTEVAERQDQDTHQQLPC